jgi:hypothetical protein
MGPTDELATHDGVSGDLFFWTVAYLDATQNLHDRVDVMLSVILCSTHVLMYQRCTRYPSGFVLPLRNRSRYEDSAPAMCGFSTFCLVMSPIYPVSLSVKLNIE